MLSKNTSFNFKDNRYKFNSLKTKTSNSFELEYKLRKVQFSKFRSFIELVLAEIFASVSIWLVESYDQRDQWRKYKKQSQFVDL